MELDIFFYQGDLHESKTVECLEKQTTRLSSASDIPYIRKHRPLDPRQLIVANDIRELSAFANLCDLSTYHDSHRQHADTMLSFMH